MNPVDLRSALHDYIDAADERHLEALYLLLGDQVSQQPYRYSADTIQEFHHRRDAHLSGQSASIPAAASIARIRRGHA